MGEKLAGGTIIPAVVARLKAMGGRKKKQTSIVGAAQKTAADKTAGNASPRPESVAIPIAIDIGWTMAVIFGQVKPDSVNDRPPGNERLPTEHELAPAARVTLQVGLVPALLG